MQTISVPTIVEEFYSKRILSKVKSYIVTNDQKIESKLFYAISQKYNHSEFLMFNSIYDALHDLMLRKIDNDILLLVSKENYYEILTSFPKIKRYLENNRAIISSNVLALKNFLQFHKERINNSSEDKDDEISIVTNEY